jgi:ABC-type polysaccharide/polyol phosphate transport system ATPase subunit
MPSEPIIWARGLGKVYQIYDRPIDRLKQVLWRGRRRYGREFWALRGINVDVQRGETVGIVGRNGAGKSTLLQLICGTVMPTEGQLRVAGRVAALLELGSGFNPEFTGRENVYMNASVLGMRGEQIEERLEAIEAFAAIGDFISQPVRTYSSGMQARLAFSVAIHMDPEILIVDEILAVGDAAFQRKCIRRFYEMRDSGCTVLFVSHDPYLVKTICQRALYLRDGQGVGFGPAADIIDRYTYDLEQSEARAAPNATAAAPAQSNESSESHALFKFIDVSFERTDGTAIEEVNSGEDVQLRARFVALSDDLVDKCSFVFNLKRHDDFYVCGTTTLMDGFEPFAVQREGEILIRFPNFRLLAGQYKWRVAINDHVGVAVLAEAAHCCPFRVVDRFQAHGLVDLSRAWVVDGKIFDRTGDGPSCSIASGQRPERGRPQ